MTKFEHGKKYKIVKPILPGIHEVGDTFTIGKAGYSVDKYGDVWSHEGLFFSDNRLRTGHVVEVKKQMTLDEIVKSKDTFVVVSLSGDSFMFSNSLLGWVDPLNNKLQVIRDPAAHESLRGGAKKIYLASEYLNGDPVWERDDKRKRESLEKMGKEIEALTEAYNKLKSELK